MIDTTGRHPGVQQLAQHFTFEHLPEDLQEVSRACTELAEEMVGVLPDGPELTTGLRKLLEAKDCFVRAGVEGRDIETVPGVHVGGCNAGCVGDTHYLEEDVV